MAEQFSTRLEELLAQLEQELKSLSLWSEIRPAKERLASELPFAVDTLEFHEWLQFVLLEKLRLPEHQDALRGRMLVHPMAEEVYRGQWATYRQLIALLRDLDELFAQPNP